MIVFSVATAALAAVALRPLGGGAHCRWACFPQALNARRAEGEERALREHLRRRWPRGLPLQVGSSGGRGSWRAELLASWARLDPERHGARPAHSGCSCFRSSGHGPARAVDITSRDSRVTLKCKYHHPSFTVRMEGLRDLSAIGRLRRDPRGPEMRSVWAVCSDSFPSGCRHQGVPET